jgi:hypothetical protein
MFEKSSRSKNNRKCLVVKYKEEFRMPENLNYYSKKDFMEAQKRYIFYRLNQA